MSSRKCKCYDCVEGLDRRQEIKHGGVTEEELPRRGPGKSKKDTKKWCKGKVGREHELTRTTYPWYSITTCKNCGKRFWGWSF